MIREPRLLDASLNEVRRIHSTAISLTLNIVPLSTATIKLPVGEKVPERSWVELYSSKGSIGVYRAREPINGYGDNDTTIELEHGITEVGDWIVNAAISKSEGINAAITELWTHYRGSRWQLDPNIAFTDSVTLDFDHDNLLESILSVVKQTPYMLTFDFSTVPWTLSLAQTGQTEVEGRLSRNVESATIQKNDAELCTRIFYCYQTKQNKQQVDVWSHYDADTISEHGIVEQKLSETTLTQAEAERKAQEYLEAHKNPKLSITINGSDLSSITGETLDNIELGKKYRLTIPDENVVVEEIVKSIQYSDIVEKPYDVTVTLAQEDDYLLEALNSQKAASRSASKTKKKLEKIEYEFTDEDGRFESYIFMNYERMELMFNDVEGLRSQVEVTASDLRSVYDDLNCNVKSTLQQTASTISAVVQGTGANAHIKPAVIQASIDAATSSSKILLSADNVVVDGELITDALVGSDIIAESISVHQITSLTGENTIDTLVVKNLTVDLSDEDGNTFGGEDCIIGAELSGSSMTLYNGAGDTPLTISISGNSLVFTDENGDTLSFSKATSLSGAWSGREFRVTASPQGETKSGFVWEHLVPIGSESVSGKWVYRDFGVYSEDTQTFEADQKLFQENIGLNATGVYNAGWDAVVLSDPDWQYPAANHQSDNTTASNSVIVAASAKTDGTERKKTIPIGIYEDVSGKSAYVSAGGYKRAVVSCSNIYKAGWDAAEGDSYLPTSGNTATATMTAKKPNSTVDGTQISQTYTVSVDSSYGYIKTTVNGVDTTVARVSHSYKYTQSEYDAALATVPAGYIAESGVTAGTSSIVWDSTNAKLYNYGYAYKSGSSSPIATSPKRESSVLSISQDSGATYNNYAASYKTVRVKLGTNDILTTNVETPWFDYDPDATVNQGTLDAGAKLKLHWGSSVLGVWQIPSSSGTVTVTDWSWNGLSNSDQSVKQKINFTVTCHVKVNGTQYTSSGLTTGNLWLKKNGIYAYLMKGNTQLANLEIRTSAPS